jgi:stage V sporulation protein AB
MKEIIQIIIGLSGGLIVGGGLAAFFTALGITSRLISMGNGKPHMGIYKGCIFIGAVLSSLAYALDFKIPIGKYTLPIIGIFMGIFVGIIASALAEMLDALPLVANFAGIGQYIYVIIFAILIGKIAGALIYWVFPGFY